MWKKSRSFPNVFEWMSRLNEAERIKCWRYLNTPNVFRFMQNLTGSNWILYLAALRTKYDLFVTGDIPLAYSSIKLHEAEWCWAYFEEQRQKLLLGPIDALTSRDIDRCWCLFYATGDLVYANRVHHIGKTNPGNSVERAAVVGAARWSYESHSRGGRLKTRPNIPKPLPLSILYRYKITCPHKTLVFCLTKKGGNFYLVQTRQFAPGFKDRDRALSMRRALVERGECRESD